MLVPDAWPIVSEFAPMVILPFEISELLPISTPLDVAACAVTERSLMLSSALSLILTDAVLELLEVRLILPVAATSLRPSITMSLPVMETLEATLALSSPGLIELRSASCDKSVVSTPVYR